MKRIIALTTVWAFLWAQSALVPHGWAQEKTDAAVTPLGAVGDVSDTQRRVLFTRLQSALSKYYRLVSPEDYAAAEEEAFEQLSAAECTEEQCIRAIQEILQVERLFSLQIIRDGDFTQIGLTLSRMDDRIIRDDSCEGCSIGQLNERIQLLVNEVIRADLDVEGQIADLPPPPPQALPRAVEESGTPWWAWVLGGLALAGLAVAAGGGDDSSKKKSGGSDGGVSVTW